MSLLAGLYQQGDSIAAHNTDPAAHGLAQDPVAKIINSIASGTPASIEFYGDSTYYGYLLGGGRASPDPIATVQAALRAHYNNSAAACINSGVSGYGTSDVIAGWNGMVAASTADIVVVGYGANDAQGAASPAIPVESYSDNLRAMTRTARELGKVVVFTTPVPFVDYGSIGTQSKASIGVQFADAMRSVAAELSVPVIDVQKMFLSALKYAGSSSLILSDGIHPTQDGYDAIGYYIANALINCIAITESGYVSCVSPSIRHYGGTNDLVTQGGSKMGFCRIANRISVPVLVTDDGLDVYIAVPTWQSGTDVCTIKVNGVVVKTISLFMAGTGAGFFIDREIMVIRNARPGAYIIDIAGEGVEDVGVSYLRAVETRSRSSYTGATVGSVPTIGIGDELRNLTFVTPSGATGENSAITDIPASCILSDVTFEFDATLLADQSVIIFAAKRANSGFSSGGYRIYLDATTGYLSVSQSTATGFDNVGALGSVDLRGADHRYTITVFSTGVLNCSVDGSSVGSYTPNRYFWGGCLGIYAVGQNQTVRIRNLSIH